jgi:hypothetical protein
MVNDFIKIITRKKYFWRYVIKPPGSYAAVPAIDYFALSGNASSKAIVAQLVAAAEINWLSS